MTGILEINIQPSVQWEMSIKTVLFVILMYLVRDEDGDVDVCRRLNSLKLFMGSYTLPWQHINGRFFFN